VQWDGNSLGLATQSDGQCAVAILATASTPVLQSLKIYYSHKDLSLQVVLNALLVF
jgi:hypothetical protein